MEIVTHVPSFRQQVYASPEDGFLKTASFAPSSEQKRMLKGLKVTSDKFGLYDRGPTLLNGIFEEADFVNHLHENVYTNCSSHST
ncbi:hypothetical protein TNCV_938121 [Trichonephila clavipes]|nr:hypothetical protein TNCV_938121 [Trichonephila clavipes]